MTPDPRLIEREIALMRERESGPLGARSIDQRAMPGAPTTSGTRASLFTLLILRDGAGPADAGRGDDPALVALQNLEGRRPARIITITPTGAQRTEATVGGRCAIDDAARRPSGTRTVCLEEVGILAGRDGVGADPGSWSPLLLRGLPVFAWLPDGLRSAQAGPWEAVLAGATGLIDGVMADSSRGTDADVARAPLCGIERLCRAVSGAFPVIDFSWRRGRVLREQSARAFDPPLMRPLLPAVSGVLLSGGTPAEAELFFRWIAGRLSRAVAAPGAGRGSPPGALRTEHAATGPLADGFAVRFTLDGAPDVEIGCTRGGCLSHAGNTEGYRAPSDGEMLVEAVDAMAPDPSFTAAVARIGEPRQ